MADHRGTSYTAKELIQTLEAGGHFKETHNLKDRIFAEFSKQELPLYIRALIGVGAVLSSFFIILFLDTADILTKEPYNRTFWGFGFLVLAITIKRQLDKGRLAASGSGLENYIMQMSFTALAVGKILLVIGLTELLKDAFSYDRYQGNWIYPCVILLITVATYHTYRMSIDRFLSSFAFFIAVSHFILTHDSIGILSFMDREPRWGPFSKTLLLINMLTVVEIAIVAVILCMKRLGRDYIPIGYGAVFGILLNVFYLIGYKLYGSPYHYDHSVGNVIFAIALCGLIYWLGRGRMNIIHLSLAIMGAVLLGLIGMPGVIFALSVMILGYALHDRVLMWLGMLSIPCFITHFYYNISFDLMTKSGVLAGSGAVLLIGWAYLKLDGRIEGGND